MSLIYVVTATEILDDSDPYGLGDNEYMLMATTDREAADKEFDRHIADSDDGPCSEVEMVSVVDGLSRNVVHLEHPKEHGAVVRFAVRGTDEWKESPVE